MIEFRNVSKTYRTLFGAEVRAVDDVSFAVAPGEVLGIAGPNGAGKSTLIAMLLGFLSPDSGEVSVDGLRPRDFVQRSGVAYLPELMTLPLTWRTDEALDRLATLAGVPKAERMVTRERVIEAVGIGEHRRKRLKALSKGNLQRVGLAQALLVERRVVVFDEPTHGLDPVWTTRFRDIVASLRRSDRAIVIASHNLDELERLSDRVAIIDRGHVQRIVAVRDAVGDGAPRRWHVRVAAGFDALAKEFPGSKSVSGVLECTVDVAELNRGLGAAIAQGALITSVTPAESSLEQAFRTAVAR